MRLPSLRHSSLLLLLMAGGAGPVEGQLDRIRRRVQRAAEDEVGRKAEAMTRNAVRCVVGDAACAEKARKDGKTAVFTDAEGQVILDDKGRPVTDARDASRAADQPGSGVWRNYDYVPGNTVWYALDLAREPIGRFPAKQLTFVSGNAQTVERDSARVLEFTAPTTIVVPLGKALPDDFTIELDFQASAPNAALVLTTSRTESRNMRTYHGPYLYLYQVSGIAEKGQHRSSTAGFWHIATEPIAYRFQVDGGPDPADDYAILYAGTERAAQLPAGEFARGDAIEIHVPATQGRPAYISRLVVAVHGAPSTRHSIGTGRSRPEASSSTSTATDCAPNRHQHWSNSTRPWSNTLTCRSPSKVTPMRWGYRLQSATFRAAGGGRHGLSHQTGHCSDSAPSRRERESEPVGGNATEAEREQNRRVVIIKRN